MLFVKNLTQLKWDLQKLRKFDESVKIVQVS